MPSVTVNGPDRKVEMSINLAFYPMPKVLMAAQDFSGSCWVDVRGVNSGRIQLSIRPKSQEQDVSLLGHEFLNYLLSLARVR